MDDLDASSMLACPCPTEVENQMTRGELFVRSLALKQDFYDAHERRAYLRMVEVGKRIVDDPSLLEHGREFFERFTRGDQHQRLAYLRWMGLLDAPPEEIVRRLLDDTEDSAELRNTAPVFVVISGEEARKSWA
jgi:hypothetical protein